MKRLPLFLFLLGFSSCASERAANGQFFNQLTLSALHEMPQGGGYSGTDATKNLLPRACIPKDNGFAISPKIARPSFCSGATYLVFLKALGQSTPLSLSLTQTLAPAPNQQDGYGLFGRWNANGPGTAKLVADLKLGINFTDWEQAQRGDFLKIWWNDHIGKRERGHLVVYLSHNESTVTFWSSNQPDGYGQKTVPLAKCQRVLFSRITQPENIKHAIELPASDPFLADMLTKEFTWEQVAQACRVK